MTTVSGSPSTDAVLREAGVPLGLDESVRDAGFFDLLNPLLRQRRIVTGLPLTATVLTVVLCLVLPPWYTATTTFIPESRSQAQLPQGLAGLAGLAGQFGLTLPQQVSQSPRFYAAVLRSREIMEPVLLTRYAVRGSRNAADSATLLSILKIRGRTFADSLEWGVKKLNELLSVNVDQQTNIVTLSVDTRDPVLSATVATRFIGYLNEFNTKHRESQARERRKFAEQRVADAGAELREAEGAVKSFYERNRGWQESPSLVFTEAALRRQVQVGQEVYLTLRREFETARIEEVNDTPVITVIDIAVPPPRKSWPRLGPLTLIALVVGTMVGCVWAYGADYLNRVRRDEDAGYREFASLLRQARRDLAAGLRGRFGRRAP